MSARIQRLVDKLQARPEEALFLERMELLEAARANLAGLPPARRYARAFAYVLAGMTVEIYPDELIVGVAREVVLDPEQERRFLALAETEDFERRRAVLVRSARPCRHPGDPPPVRARLVPCLGASHARLGEAARHRRARSGRRGAGRVGRAA